MTPRIAASARGLRRFCRAHVGWTGRKGNAGCRCMKGGEWVALSVKTAFKIAEGREDVSRGRPRRGWCKVSANVSK